jgi:hypothetical protein
MAEVEKTITISGTVFAVPTIAYTAPGTAGNTTTSGITIRNVTRGERVTWSGAADDQTLDYGATVTFNYDTYKVLLGSAVVDHTGKFSRFEPGDNNIIISFSGHCMGGSATVTYSPRYY